MTFPRAGGDSGMPGGKVYPLSTTRNLGGGGIYAASRKLYPPATRTKGRNVMAPRALGRAVLFAGTGQLHHTNRFAPPRVKNRREIRTGNTRDSTWKFQNTSTTIGANPQQTTLCADMKAFVYRDRQALFDLERAWPSAPYYMLYLVSVHAVHTGPAHSSSRNCIRNRREFPMMQLEAMFLAGRDKGLWSRVELP